MYAPKKDKSGKEKIRPHFSKTSFDLKPIQKEAVWDGVLQPESQWAFPHWGSCQIAMRQSYENYGLCLGQSKKLKSWVLDTFTEEKINDNFINQLLGFDPAELNDWLSSLDEMVEL